MIFYFTGTGNTKWVAKQISEAIGEELFYIPDLIRKGQYQFELKQNETIGFCFPTHGWQPPRIVRDFITKLSFSKKKHLLLGPDHLWRQHRRNDDDTEQGFSHYRLAGHHAVCRCDARKLCVPAVYVHGY